MILWGIDVSSHQAGLTQTTVNAVDVLVVKATEGTGYKNPLFQTHFNMGVAANKKVGVYHFWRRGATGTAQADYFLAYVGKNIPDFWVLDFEDASDAANEAGALEFLKRVEQKTGTKPILYTYGSQLVAHQYSRIGDAGYPLWLAHYYYTSADGFGTDRGLDFVASYWGLSGWKLAGWQYTENGRLPGYSGPLDFNIFDERYLGGGGSESSGSGMVYPVEGYKITQNFGDGRDLSTNLGGGHTGTDWATPTGTPLKAVADGMVLWADWAKNLPQTSWEARWYLTGGGFMGVFTDAGIVLVIDHGDYLSISAHLNETKLNTGDRVTAGQVVGKTGNTGYTTGPHLHFEILPKPFAWGNGYYGRTDAVGFIKAREKRQDWFDMATEKDLENVIERVLSKERKRKGAGQQGNTSITGVIQWFDYHMSQQNKKLDAIKNQLQIVWGGIFTEFSYSGKPGTNEPGIIRLLKAEAGKVAELEKKLDALGVVAANGGEVTNKTVSAVTGISEERLIEILGQVRLGVEK